MSFQDRQEYGYDFMFNDSTIKVTDREDRKKKVDVNKRKLKETTSRLLDKLSDVLKFDNYAKISFNKPISYIDARQFSTKRYQEPIMEFINNAELSLGRKNASHINRKGRGQLAYEELMFEKIRDSINKRGTIQNMIKQLKAFNEYILIVETKNHEEHPYDYRIVYYTFYNEETKIN